METKTDFRLDLSVPEISCAPNVVDELLFLLLESFMLSHVIEKAYLNKTRSFENFPLLNSYWFCLRKSEECIMTWNQLERL